MSNEILFPSSLDTGTNVEMDISASGAKLAKLAAMGPARSMFAEMFGILSAAIPKIGRTRGGQSLVPSSAGRIAPLVRRSPSPKALGSTQ